MYLARPPRTTPPATSGCPTPEDRARPGRWLAVGHNVVLLGLTSLVTDASAEMVGAALPLFLTVRLGLTPLQFGSVDGLLQFLAALTAIGGAVLADRWRRHKEVAVLGYAIGASTKLGLLTVGSWGPAAAWLGADRAGKGIRTAPRDAMISMSAPPGRLGEAFGVHRALDTAGALIGPVLAFAILSLTATAYDAVFVTGFWLALVGVALIMLFVDNPARTPGISIEKPRRADFAVLLRLPGFRSVLLAAGAVSVVTASDSFLFLALQRLSGMDERWFPLLFVGSAAVYLLAAVPAGRLADRFSAGRVFLTGQALLVAVYASLALSRPGLPAVVAVLIGLGGYFAATDGVLAALVSQHAPEPLRATALAMLATVLAAGRAGAAVGFGAVWTWLGPRAAVILFAAGLGVATLIAGMLVRSPEGALAREDGR